MLFDLNVKERREDFFNYDKELELLKRAMNDDITRMIVIKGIRRIGKSSLIRVALNELKIPYVLIDARLLGVASVEDLLSALATALTDAIKKFVFFRKLRSVLTRVSGIGVAGLSVIISGKKLSVFAEFINLLNEFAEKETKRVVMVFDEAQDLRMIRGFEKVLAHVYDYCKNVKIVIAGSEVGVLDRLLGKNNPKAPLYGRAYLEIPMNRLDAESSKEFLRRGFEQLGVKVDDKDLNEAVAKLDGIIGWLTFYGYYRYHYGHEEALRRAVSEGTSIVRRELENFLSIRRQARRRYLTIIKLLREPLSWSEIKRGLELELGMKIHQQQISRYLRELVDYGFLEKHENLYKLADPLLYEAVKSLK